MARNGTEIPRPDARLVLLAERYRLPEVAARKLSLFAAKLSNDPLAPTSVRDPAKAIDDHLADSLVALELEEARSASEIADLGSGAGLPGLPLAIARPTTRVALVESAARKCAFINSAIRECGVDNAEVVNARVERWREGLGRFDLVTARAVGPLEAVVEYAAPLLQVGGALIAWRGRRDSDAEAAAERAALELGMQPEEIRPVRPYPEARHRHLYVTLKVRETPSRFPRRPGRALKKPLGR